MTLWIFQKKNTFTAKILEVYIFFNIIIPAVLITFFHFYCDPRIETFFDATACPLREPIIGTSIWSAYTAFHDINKF